MMSGEKGVSTWKAANRAVPNMLAVNVPKGKRGFRVLSSVESAYLDKAPGKANNKADVAFSL